MNVKRTTQRLALIASVTLGAWACNSGGTGDEDERGSVGPAHPGYKYCTDRGGVIDNAKDLCVFSDGTTCAPIPLWNGECGQAHSYCVEKGGKLERKERDMGGWTAIVAVCTLNGKECDEHDFIRTGKCGE